MPRALHTMLCTSCTSFLIPYAPLSRPLTHPLPHMPYLSTTTQVLCEVVGTIGLRTLLILPSLMPTLTATLGSTNEKLRCCAAAALDAVSAAVLPQPQMLLQGLAQVMAGGSARSRLAVVDKLQELLPQVCMDTPEQHWGQTP